MSMHITEELIMKQLLIALSVAVLALGTTVALADDTSDAKLISEMDMKPMTPAETAQLKAGHDAAKAKWAAMTPAEKAAVTQSMKSKKVADMNHLDKVAQDNDMTAMTQSETAQAKAEHDAAKAKWAAMTPDQKAAVHKAAQQKHQAELSTIERAGQEDSMARHLGN
jgi:predicted Fe-S protein YdhL (DUF1289 family)